MTKQEGQSAASAKPAPRPTDLIARDLRGLLTPLTRPFDQIDEYTLNQLLSELEELEVPPAAERTAFAEIRKRVERESYWCEDCQHEIPKGADYLDDFHADHEVVRITVIEGWLATEIDAQEKAGAQT